LNDEIQKNKLQEPKNKSQEPKSTKKQIKKIPTTTGLNLIFEIGIYLLLVICYLRCSTA
jgi:hypothetical protein